MIDPNLVAMLYHAAPQLFTKQEEDFMRASVGDKFRREGCRHLLMFTENGACAVCEWLRK